MGYRKIAGQKTLGDLITILSRLDSAAPISLLGGYQIGGICSYRGYYEDLAFVHAESFSVTPAFNTVGELLTALENSVGTVFEGWKGGDYTAGLDTVMWVSMDSGNLGDMLTGISVEVDGSFSISTVAESTDNW